MIKRKIVISIVLVVAIGFLGYTITTAYIQQQREQIPQFAKVTQDRSSHFISGPVSKDLFPDISHPVYVSAKKADTFLDDTDQVLFFQMGKKIYVYPDKILGYHHIVNDVIGGKPVVITTCLLSDSAMVYSRQYNHQVLSFGVLGPLYFGNLVMYDRNTNSSWIQLTGERIQGKMNVPRLTPIAVLRRATWGKMKKDGSLSVLSPEKDKDFYANFYDQYSMSYLGLQATIAKGTKIDSRLKSFTKGLGITMQASAAFYPLDTIAKEQVINTSLGSWEIAVIYNQKLSSYEIFRRWVNGRDITLTERGQKLFDRETGSEWNFDGQAISGPLQGKTLATPVYTEAYWYSWSSFYPKTFIPA